MRHRTTYRSPSLTNGAASPSRIIHNAFPELTRPLECAYYLPIIDALYLPPGVTADHHLVKIWHEAIHKLLSDAAAICEQRLLSTMMLLMIAITVVDDSATPCRLQVPSFV